MVKILKAAEYGNPISGRTRTMASYPSKGRWRTTGTLLEACIHMEIGV